jgi:hypothetical protein
VQQPFQNRKYRAKISNPKLLKDADVKPGGPVPNEESLNPWIYTRYGSFTGKTIYEVKEGVLEEKSDLERG